MKKISLAVLVVFFAGLLWGSSSKIKEYQTFRDFSRGESKGVAIRHDGVITLAPRVKKIFGTNLPQIWRLVQDQNTFFAAAGSPASVIKVDARGDTSTVFKSDAAAVFAMAIDATHALWFAPSPGGEIYRYLNGKAEKVATLKVTYIWDILPHNGELLVATGEPGKIFRVSTSGKTSTFFESNETHIRTLAADSRGRIYAGSADNGLIYRFDAQGSPFVLYDSPQTEVFSILPLQDGGVWAACASEGLQRPAPPTGRVTLTEISIEGKKEGGGGQGEQEAAPLPPAQGLAGAGRNKGAIYKISADGVARNFWKGMKDRAQSICSYQQGAILAGTGDDGKIYEISPTGEVNLLLTLEPSQVTFMQPAGNGVIYATTANLGAAFEIEKSLRAEGEYLSPVIDAKIYAQWGSLAWASHGTVSLYVRSGNSQKPDKTWSAWAGPLTQPSGSNIKVPVARFLQWRAELKYRKGVAPALSRVTVGYMQENAPPEIESITVYEPGVAYPDAVSEGKTPQSAEVHSNRGTNGHSRSSRSWKKETKKGYQSIGWRASDVNNDRLVYDVYYKEIDSPAWRPLVKNYSTTVYSWDSRALEDGVYVVKVVATDQKSNAPGRGFTREKVSQPFTIDNTPPEISPLKLSQSNPPGLTFTAKDAGTWVSAAYFALDAQEWKILYPDDGIADSPLEHFTLRLRDLKPGKHIVTVKVYDKNDNVRYRHLNFKL